MFGLLSVASQDRLCKLTSHHCNLFFDRVVENRIALGHHALGANIEQILTILLSEKKLGGFHLTMKSC